MVPTDGEGSSANILEQVTMAHYPLTSAVDAFGQTLLLHDTGEYPSSIAKYDTTEWLFNTEHGQLFEGLELSPMPSTIESDMDSISDVSNTATFRGEHETREYLSSATGCETPQMHLNAEHSQLFEPHSPLRTLMPSNIGSDSTSASDASDGAIFGNQVASEATLNASAKRRMKVPKYRCSFCPQMLTSRNNLISKLVAHALAESYHV
jgi:hypothetical protein